MWSFGVALWEILTFAREQPHEAAAEDKVRGDKKQEKLQCLDVCSFQCPMISLAISLFEMRTRFSFIKSRALTQERESIPFSFILPKEKENLSRTRIVFELRLSSVSCK